MAADYRHDGQQRMLALLSLLAGHEITGIAPAEVARQQACSASVVTRDLANLRSFGWAEQVPETGRWRLAPAITQLAIRHMSALERAQARLDETRNRYSRAG